MQEQVHDHDGFGGRSGSRQRWPARRRRCFHHWMLLERADQLAALHAYRDEAGSGSGRLVFVGGEAGVGKTALTRAFTSGLNGATVRRGTADNPSAAAPLGLFLDALADEVTEPAASGDA